MRGLRMLVGNLKVVGVLLVLAVAAAGSGCGQRPAESESNPVPQRGDHPEPELPQGPPEELLAIAAESLEQAGDTARLLASGINRELRLRKLQRHIDHGLAASDAAAVHQRATPEQIRRSQLIKLRLLYEGVQHDASTNRPCLQQFVAELRQRQPQGQVAAAAAAILLDLDVITANVPHEDALKALADYGRQFPDSPAGPRLFHQLGRKLEQKNQSAAVSCYAQGWQLYGRLPAAEPLRLRLAQLEQAQQVRINDEQRKLAEEARIRAELRSPDGYFVIYTHEVVPPKGIMTTYYFEYEVLRGADAVVHYVLGLKPSWQWKLVQRFPETSAGYQQATAMADERRKKETFMSYPVFEQ